MDPDIQLSEYHRRLMGMVQSRYDAIRNGRAQPSEWTMPGARAFLERLRSQNLPVIVLSGTSKDQIQKEADLLDLSPLVDDWHAPIGDDPSFSKCHALERVLREAVTLYRVLLWSVQERAPYSCVDRTDVVHRLIGGV